MGGIVLCCHICFAPPPPPPYECVAMATMDLYPFLNMAGPLLYLCYREIDSFNASSSVTGQLRSLYQGASIRAWNMCLVPDRPLLDHKCDIPSSPNA